MDFTTLFFVAIGLAMDAFAVSIAQGVASPKFRIGHAMKVGIFFGFFQAFMPVLGWALGFQFKGYIEKVDHWVAFGILFIIGAKMIYNVLYQENDTCEVKTNNKHKENRILLMLAIATSIDALAVGISFAFLNTSIIHAAVIIGVITFLLSAIGVFIGKKFGCLFQKQAEIFGGVALILIGIKICIGGLV